MLGLIKNCFDKTRLISPIRFASKIILPMRTRVGITGACALFLATCLPAPRAQGQTVKAAPGSVEVPSAHGRTWLFFPDPLLTVRMDRNGNVTASAAPISVAHEETSPMCAAVLMVSAMTSTGAGSSSRSFPSPGSCSFDATAATLILPVDKLAGYASICKQPWKETPPPYNCTVDNAGRTNCVYTGISQPLPLVGPAWRRAEGWSGRVPYNGVVQVVMNYAMAAPERVKDLINPGVQVTCDAVPCVTFPKALPEATTGRPYRAQLFAGAHAPVTITGASTSTPPGLSAAADGYLSGAPTTPGVYEVSVGFDESYACPWNMQTMLSGGGGKSHWSQKFQMTVRDGTPPVVSSVTTSADTVPASGGNVVVTAQATDNAGVVKMMSSRLRPDGTSNTMEMARVSGSAASGTWTITWPIAANSTPTPDSSTIKVWALDAAGNSGYGTQLTVVAQGQSGQELQRLQIKKP